MKAINNKTKNRVSALLVALAVVTVMAVAAPTASAMTLASLKGPWQATIVGQGGCGMGSKLLNFTLDASGVSTSGTWTANTVSCGSTSIPLTFTITSLNADGSGTATAEAGGGVFNYIIQVNVASNMFNIVEVFDAGNYEAGTAVKQ
jgi:hypothetical protein